MKSIDKFNDIDKKYVNSFFDNDNRHRPWVKEFEDSFGRTYGTKYNIACANGTAALHAAVVACGVKPGDEVILPAISVIMDAWAIAEAGGVPIFADVEENSHLISLESIRSKITKKTKAIIVISWDGLSCDMDPIMDLAKSKNILVIDDCSRSVMAYYKTKLVGTIADISTFSFQMKKHITTGSEGGMIVSNNEDLAIKARRFAGIGYKHFVPEQGVTNLSLEQVQNPEYKRFGFFGLNYRMNDLSAAMGIAQIERMNEIVDWRKHCGTRFLEAIKNFDWLIPQSANYDHVHSYYTFSFINNCYEKFGISWRDFYKMYKDKGGDGFYSCVAVPFTEPAFKDFIYNEIEHQISNCEVALDIQKKIMCFKTNYRNEEDLQKNCKILKELCMEIEEND
ncbi:DegT/DnrJ/EryC1/StrS family aminotransferase [Gammaproteobacteria bacterium]|nr:DegT/DnrJ/EryC1/StrS family aminotransferase [Gammaproteobacteria bacterium]